MVTTSEGGPEWKNVVYRTVRDLDTGEIIEEKRLVAGVPNKELCRVLGQEDRRLETRSTMRTRERRGERRRDKRRQNRRGLG